MIPSQIDSDSRPSLCHREIWLDILISSNFHQILKIQVTDLAGGDCQVVVYRLIRNDRRQQGQLLSFLLVSATVRSIVISVRGWLATSFSVFH